MIFMMCSCSKAGETPPQGVSVKTVTDTKGNSYEMQFDQDGFPVIDDKGNALSEDGAEKVPFPGIVVSGNEITTRFFRFELPEKWENSSGELVKAVYKEGSLSAEITVNERFSMTATECVKEIENIAADFGTVKKEMVDFDFATATKLVYENGVQIYVFSVENRTFFVKVVADNEMYEKINFEEIVNTIKFRKGE